MTFKHDTPLLEHAQWIGVSEDIGAVCPVFRKTWTTEKRVEKAELTITALGVYEAVLNGERVGDFPLAPGWTVYEKRLQVQRYDVTNLLRARNELTVLVGKGWYASPMPGWMENEDKLRRKARRTGLIGELRLTFSDGNTLAIPTGEDWQWSESATRFSEIYDGEHYDATYCPSDWRPAETFDGPTETLIPQEGEEIRECGRIAAKSVFTTPAGETVVDFGQEITGYLAFTVDARAGERIRVLHGETLDRDGNFYNANYRSAKAEIDYICKDGVQTWHPRLTFFGFRYVKLAEFPGQAKAEQFTAVVLQSRLRRTGYLSCSDENLNRLFSNILWGQKCNFLDVPTDCPQRDERLGWTGDAQVFVKAASYQFDVERFFRKWLRDLSAAQRPDGAVGEVIPDYLPELPPSAGWGDAAVICPWRVYRTYGDVSVLEEQFDSMRRWIDYITATTATPNLWTGAFHFGDWLGLDAPQGSYKGSSRDDFIASAFYAYSTGLVIRAGKILGRDVSAYETLYGRIIAAFRDTFPTYQTQTECVLAAWFGLAENPQSAANQLAEMIRANGGKMATGFIGTPYLLHVLSRYGHNALAYQLLLRREYPSWLYAVGKGATTVWEHWDSIMEDGSFWSTDMNSLNHYAYGSVADWVYEEAAGIRPAEAGFATAIVAPRPDPSLHWLEARLETRRGLLRSKWSYEESAVRYEISAEMPVTVTIDGTARELPPGDYLFWGKA